MDSFDKVNLRRDIEYTGTEKIPIIRCKAIKSKFFKVLIL